MERAYHRIDFAHGKEGTPDGSKIRKLSEIAVDFGFSVESPDYRFTMNPDERVAHFLRNAQPPAPGGKWILAGSSMGGYLSLVASARVQPQGLFLLAPALGLPGYGEKAPLPVAEHVTIIHGWHDEVVPVDNVIAFARLHRARLHLVDSDHRLLSAMPLIEELFTLFLREVLDGLGRPAMEGDLRQGD